MIFKLEEETTLEQVELLSTDIERSLSQIANFCTEGQRFTAINESELAGLMRVLENTAHIMTAKVKYLVQMDYAGKRGETA